MFTDSNFDRQHYETFVLF